MEDNVLPPPCGISRQLLAECITALFRLCLKAEGPVFSSGHDLKELTSAQGREYHTRVFHTCAQVSLSINFVCLDLFPVLIGTFVVWPGDDSDTRRARPRHRHGERRGHSGGLPAGGHLRRGAGLRQVHLRHPGCQRGALLLHAGRGHRPGCAQKGANHRRQRYP